MQAGKAGKVQSAINVTPLVDVVLVLLIIFMVVAPQLQAGPTVDLPETEQPEKRDEGAHRVLVSMAHDGRVWVDDEAVAADAFADYLKQVAETKSEWKVVIEADGRLTFGAVKQAMLAVEAAGFGDVGLITEKRAAGTGA